MAEITAAWAKNLEGMMNRVSRSFALVVPGLEKPPNYHITTAYQIFRVIDHIEDCT